MLPRLSAWPEWHRLKEARRAVQVRAIKKGVVENQKSQSASGNARSGWEFLIRCQV